MGQLQSKKIYVHQLELGMYASGLDRPWLETPFNTQGFMIRDAADIQKLSLYCDYVYIDSERSVANLDMALSNKASKEASQKRSQDRKPFVASCPIEQELSARHIHKYQDKTTVTTEIIDANNAYQKIKSAFDGMAGHINSGKKLNIASLSTVVTPLVESIVRNPGASIWLARLKSQDSYTHRHCIAVAIWCSVIGRQIGLPKKELAQLFMGGMLLDIGKLKIPPELLNKKKQLSDREFSLVKKHVDLSLKLAADASPRIPQAVTDMIASHHECFNGTGYPQSLQGTEIPLYARIAAIADCYDAITSQRVYAKPIPHSLAMRKMYRWRGYDFQPELIEAFIQSLGIYPTGTMVELSSGEVGIVVKENPGKRLRPQVLVILDEYKKQLEDFREIDLATPVGEDRKVIEIRKTLEPGAYGLDPEALYI